MADRMGNLFPSRAIFNTLGALMKQPMLLEDGKIRLDRADFIAEDMPKFQLIIFATISNLYDKGSASITPADMEGYLADYPDLHKTFMDNDGVNWCYEALELSKVENYEVYATKVKKYSLLRELQNKGISIEGIYDASDNPDEVDEQAQGYFDSLSIDDIIKEVEMRVGEISSAFQIGYDRESTKAGDNGIELLKQFKEKPLYGLPTVGEMQNTIFRGLLSKTGMLRSSATNTGKCIVGDSLIFTDKGMLEIEDVVNHYDYNPETHELKAKVISYEPDLKRQVRDTSHWYDMGIHDTIKVTTVHGYDIEGTPEHPVMINRYGKVMWCRLDEVTTEDYLIVSLNNQMFGTIETGRDLSYLLGFLTGDGYNNVSEGINQRGSLSYSKNNSEIYTQINQMIRENLRGVNKISQRYKKNTQGKITTIDHDYGNHKTIKHLVELGLTMNTSAHKEIPKRIMQGTKEDMKSFLQGLFDTDGSAVPIKTKNSNKVNYLFEYSTASKKLAQQVQVALANFGVIAKRREKFVRGNPYYIVTVQNMSSLTVFMRNIGFRLASEKQRKIKISVEGAHLFKGNNDKYINKPLLAKLHRQLIQEPNNGYNYVKTGGGSYSFGGRAFQHVISRGVHNGCDRTGLLRGFETVGTSLEDPDILHIYNTVKNTMSSRVKKIEKSRNRVYDFTVPETHSFVANGLISHNTRIALGEATDIAISKWYNHKTKKWEKRGNKHKVLFISTEMSEDELQPTMWAYISGVPEEKIIDGKLSEQEEELVEEAILHLQECDLFIEYVSKFDPQTINSIIKEYATRHEIEVVYFDYIHLSFEIMIEIASKTQGMSMREDMMLTIFASGLEQLARDYNFHLRTSTQINGGASQVDQSSEMLDQNLLRGAKAMADKFQYGVMMTKPSVKELEQLEPITSQGFGKVPNMVYHIYKNRKTKWKGKLYLHIDYDTMRIEELFFTSFDGKLVNVPKTVLEEHEEEDTVEKPLF